MRAHKAKKEEEFEDKLIIEITEQNEILIKEENEFDDDIF